MHVNGIPQSVSFGTNVPSGQECRAPDAGRRRSAAPARRRIWAGNSRVPGQVRQRRKHVELRKHSGSRLQPLRRRGRRLAQLDEQLVFQFLGLLVGREHFFLVLLQLRRDVALGVLDRLLAVIIVGNLVAVRVRDFEVIAEHFVEADFQAGDAGAGDFLGLILGDPLLAAGREIAQRVELRMKPAADQAALAAGKRAIVHQRFFQPRANFGAQIQFRFQAIQ